MTGIPSEPLLWQRMFHAERSAWGRFAGGAFGAGKSFALCMDAMTTCSEYPGTCVGLVRLTLMDVEATTLKVLMEDVLGVTLETVRDHPLVARANLAKHWLRLINGSEIHWLGCGESGGRTAGGARSRMFGALYFDEITEISEEHHREWVARLRHPLGPNRWAAATNPEPNWCKDRFHPGSRNRAPDVAFFQTSTRDNIHLPPEYEARLRATYPEIWVRRFLDGSWEVFEGQVFTEFDPQVHVGLFDVPPPGIWREFSVMDVGFRNPTAWYLFGIDYDGKMYVWGEHYQAEWRPSQHAEVIVPVVKARGVKLNLADPSAWRREATSGGNSIAGEYGKCGLHLSQANNDVRGGIQAMKRRLADRMVMFHPSCEELLRELPAYRWKSLTPGREAYAPEEEEPVKRGDHAMDCWRYAENYARAGGLGRPELSGPDDLLRLHRDSLARRGKVGDAVY